MLDHMEYSHSSAEETHSSTTPAAAAAAMRKKRSTTKNNNKRRFSDEQIRSLESMFETETRLEPMKKTQLARELGLQPRQVAIWFQNKRARWKSKQLERDYAILRANYNCLASRFDALKKEKHALLIQFQTLAENGGTSKREGEAVAKASTSTERSDSENILGVLSEGDSSIREQHFGQLEDEPALLSFADGSLTSPAQDWDTTLESEDLLGQSAASDYQLWDFSS